MAAEGGRGGGGDGISREGALGEGERGSRTTRVQAICVESLHFRLPSPICSIYDCNKLPSNPVPTCSSLWTQGSTASACTNFVCIIPPKAGNVASYVLL